MNVDNQSVVHAFSKGRAKDPRTHEMLVKLLNLQLEQGFLFVWDPERFGAYGKRSAHCTWTSWRLRSRRKSSHREHL